MIRVFVSSVANGLEETRTQVIHDLQKANYEVGAMEQFGASPQPPIDVCLRQVRKADVLILIVGPRYGSLLPQGISYTHAEFREARALGLPVIAIRIPDLETLDAEESQHLRGFLDEIGSVATYSALDSRDSLHRVSPLALAGLSKAKDEGHLIRRFSLFQPFQAFLPDPQAAPAALFNHTGPFVGRHDQVKQIVDFALGDAALLLLKAPGGAGKSRLLLEAARRLGALTNAPRMLFVDAGAQWVAEDINELPRAPLVLVLDDAHRRQDLDGLIGACRQVNGSVRCIASCRPSAHSIVAHSASRALGEVPSIEIDLPALSESDAIALASHYLGTSYSHLARRLVKIADRNPLVIRVGGRCIAQSLVAPELLERTPEAFRTQALDRLLDDPSLSQRDPAKRRLLEIIAAIGPAITEGADFHNKLSAIINQSPSEARRILATLERSGLLLRRGRSVRVTPDVLADHLLYRAAVDDSGHPTGFVEEMIQHFCPAHLENLLANAAELDWRASMAGKHEPVLQATWREIERVLPGATRTQRAQLLSQMKRAAAFAPDRVLAVAEWMADHPDAPRDEQLADWGLDDPLFRVQDALTDTFYFIAPHPDYTKRCLARLWSQASVDARPTNPRPGHPRRRLQDLLTYNWQPDLFSLDGLHAKTVSFVVSRLTQPSEESKVWAVSVLGSALARLGEANQADRRQFHLRQFSLASHLSAISERRHRALECLGALSVAPGANEALASLHELGRLLRTPHGPFGQALQEEDVAAWEPEAREVIATLARAAELAPTEAIRFMARRELREAPRGHWPAISAAIEQAISGATPLPHEQVYDLLMGIPRHEQEKAYEAEDRRIQAICDATATNLWLQHRQAKHLVHALLGVVSSLKEVVPRTAWPFNRLIRSIVTEKLELAEDFIHHLVVSGEEAWSMLTPALLGLHSCQPERAEALFSSFADSKAPRLRAQAAESAQGMVEGSSNPQRILAVADKLSEDADVGVRRATIELLRRFRTCAPDAARSILTRVKWDGAPELASATFDVLHPDFGLDPNGLSDDDIAALLRRVQELPALQHDTLEFISFASERHARGVVEMLLGRVRAADEHARNERWTPIPYNAHGLSLPGLRNPEEHEQALRLIRDTFLEVGALGRFWLPELFHSAVQDLNVGVSLLREWVDSEDDSRVIGAACLIRGFDHSLIFSEHGFISDLLQAASNCGPDCLQRVRSELFSLAVSGTYTGAPGRPSPRLLADRDQARQFAELHDDQDPARRFYLDLMHSAEEMIKRDVLEWEEED